MLVRDNYLVFVRGGLNHALYSVIADKLLFTEQCPRCKFKESVNSDTLQFAPDQFDESKMMDSWVREHLHDPINEMIVDRQ